LLQIPDAAANIASPVDARGIGVPRGVGITGIGITGIGITGIGILAVGVLAARTAVNRVHLVTS
jgi:hypothetical protein